MLCSKLHCLKTFKLSVFSYKIIEAFSASRALHLMRLTNQVVSWFRPCLPRPGPGTNPAWIGQPHEVHLNEQHHKSESDFEYASGRRGSGALKYKKCG